MKLDDYMKSGASVGELQPKNGRLIVFEGGDGTGKGEMIHRAQEYLSDLGTHLVVTKDPGGTSLGQSIRQLLFVEPSTKNMAPGVCDLLFLASHLQNYHTVVKPHLDAGGTVITDRWWYSQFTYSAHRYCIPEIEEAYKKHHGPRANLLVFLHGDAEVCLARANARTELHQSGKTWNNIEDFRKVQQTYFDMFEKWPEFKPVSVTQKSIDEVWLHVRRDIDSVMGVHSVA